MVQPIAQISCWVDGEPSGSYKPPVGFHICKSLDATATRRNSELAVDLPLFPGRALSIGRDHYENDISINHPYVSKKHFVIYSVVYDLNDAHSQPPLIYVRDCQSLEGTYINEVCIGNEQGGASPGFYVSRDIVISVEPYWKFRVSLLNQSELKYPLNAIQLSESNSFSDRYIITDRTIGSGAFATVRLATNVQTGKQLACKIHDLDRLRRLADTEDLVRRAFDETDLLGKLRHPNLPTLEYAFRSAHTLYTFTELATGGDLFSMRVSRGTLDEQECKFIIGQIVNAIRYLHKGDIVHRDLKPENVFFATGPDLRSRVIVGDLGFARSTVLGRMASRVGTDQYMAPEVEYGQEHGKAVDLWSLGMITVFLLAPDSVAAGSFVKTSQAAINEWMNSVLSDLSHHEISEHCQDFIKSCLMFEPKRRIDVVEAKRHPWLQRYPDKKQFKFRITESIEAWKKTARTIAPPVQELPDMENVKPAQPIKQGSITHLSTSIKSRKRKLADITLGTSIPKKSPYFSGKPAVSKRLKSIAADNEGRISRAVSEPTEYFLEYRAEQSRKDLN